MTDDEGSSRRVLQKLDEIQIQVAKVQARLDAALTLLALYLIWRKFGPWWALAAMLAWNLGVLLWELRANYKEIGRREAQLATEEHRTIGT